MTITKKQIILRDNLFQEALENFKEQFKVTLEITGFNNDHESNDGIGETEFFVHDLINGPLKFEVGGWFSHDTRDNGDTIYCLLGVKLDGKDLADCKALQSRYDIKTKEWSELKYESY